MKGFGQSLLLPKANWKQLLQKGWTSTVTGLSNDLPTEISIYFKHWKPWNKDCVKLVWMHHFYASYLSVLEINVECFWYQSCLHNDIIDVVPVSLLSALLPVQLCISFEHLEIRKRCRHFIACFTWWIFYNFVCFSESILFGKLKEPGRLVLCSFLYPS